VPREWTIGRVALATLVTLAIGFTFFLLYQFYTIVFIFFVAFTLAIAIRPLVDWLRTLGLQEWLGVLVVYALLLVVIVALVWLVGPFLIEQINALVAQLPEYYSQLRLTLANSGNRLLVQVVRVLPSLPQLSAPDLSQDASPFAVLTPAWKFIKTSSYAVFVFGAIMLLAFYWTLEGEIISRRLMLLVPINRREEVHSLLTEMGGTIGGYFRGQAILCLLIGTLSLIGYWAIGLPNALGLALVMGVFEAIPMIGPTLGAIPAVLVAFSTSPEQALWVLGVVVVIQVLENNLLVPRVMNQSVGVNPVVSILSIAAFGALFGVGGAILAIPLAAMLQIVLSRLLFQLPTPEQLVAVAQTATSTNRSAASKLRLQAQELLVDVRKGVPEQDGDADPEFEKVQDNLEAIALKVEGLLRRAEQSV
jgi:predicted PurR-regulated permease PerM